MMCKYSTMMIKLASDYEYENVTGKYFFCPYCWRIFYYDLRTECNDKSVWIEPAYLDEVKNEEENKE